MTINHILVRSKDNFVHESAFFWAFSEIMKARNMQSDSEMTNAFTLFNKTKTHFNTSPSDIP